jgi:radical SAM protein
MKHLDYAQAPLLLIWEITRACALACRHCRASAEDVRDPRELSLEQGKDLIRQVKAMGTPLMVLTGGDPLQRDDLEELIRYGKSVGLVMATIPAATDRLTQARIQSLAAAGVDQLALSLDGATAETHDTFRQVEGTYDKVIEGAGWIRETGVPLQINTVFGAWNADEFDAIAARVEELGTAFWEIFFLVPIGRGSQIQGCTVTEMESLFERIHTLSKRVPFRIKVTEGQQYRRFYHQKEEEGDSLPWRGKHPPVADQPVNAGLGFCFVSHTGSIQPSGFLPLDCGNVRTSPIATVYQHHPTFRDLRDLSKVHGKCAGCPYLAYCSGGSRARAYAMTGDALASDPMCGIGFLEDIP